MGDASQAGHAILAAVTTAERQSLSLTVGPESKVDALLTDPPRRSALLVLAPGAGADMDQPFLEHLATDLAERAIATLRYRFPYMQRRMRRPDAPPVCHATVRAAVAAATLIAAGAPVFAGGKSFGGRMTSQAQALQPLPGVGGLVFIGFPLHPAGEPGIARAEHLAAVRIPMLFLSGSRDALAETTRLEGVVAALGPGARLRLFAEADHSLHVPARSGRTDRQVQTELSDVLAGWIAEQVQRKREPRA